MGLANTYTNTRVDVLEPWEPVVNGDFAVGNIAPSLETNKGGILMAQATGGPNVNKWAFYASGGSNGLNKCLAISKYPFKTDASGNIVSQRPEDKMAVFEDSQGFYVRGWKFKVSDLFVFDGTTYTAPTAADLAQLGKVADGILYM